MKDSSPGQSAGRRARSPGLLAGEVWVGLKQGTWGEGPHDGASPLLVCAQLEQEAPEGTV